MRKLIKYSNSIYRFSNQFVVGQVSGVGNGVFIQVVDGISMKVRKGYWADFDIRNWKRWEPHK